MTAAPTTRAAGLTDRTDIGMAVLAEHFGHRMIEGCDPRYDSARAVWNGMVDRRPLAVVRCVDSRDVSIALWTAADAGLPLSVRGGGHQIAGGAVVDDGIVLDLCGMRQVDIDVAGGVVTVGGGALLGDLDRALARHDLAVPAGVVSHTGVGGLTVGGGIGWLSRSSGLTCDRLTGATVVDGCGRELEVDEHHHPDLFWAIRGGGGNFGVVTEFRFRTAPIGPVAFGTRIVSLDQAAAALLEYGRLAPDLPRDLQVMVKLQKRPSSREAGNCDAPVVTFEWLWSGDPARAEQAAGLMRLGDRGTVSWTQRRFAEIQSQQDHRYPHGRHYFLKPGHLDTITEEQVAAILGAADGMPSGDTQIEILLLGGAIADVDEAATAYPKRNAGLAFNVTAGWSNPLESDGHVEWVRRTYGSLNMVAAVGAYLNFVGAEKPDLESIFGPAKLSRLRRVKREYDPHDVFRPMAHIEPETEQEAT